MRSKNLEMRSKNLEGGIWGFMIVDFKFEIALLDTHSYLVHSLGF
jgi:hypothetical protein